MVKSRSEKIAELQKKADQLLAKLQSEKALQAKQDRALDTRRKIILGGLLIDAATKDKQWEKNLNVILSRISKPNDLKAFEGWSLRKDDEEAFTAPAPQNADTAQSEMPAKPDPVQETGSASPASDLLKL